MRRQDTLFRVSAAVLALLVLSSYSVIDVFAASNYTATFHFQVVDSQGNHVTGCKPIVLKKRVKEDSHWRWKKVGKFSDGDSKTVHTQKLVFLLKTARGGWCEGYEFDRWEVTGSGIQEVRELSKNRLKVKLSDGASVTVTLHLKKLWNLKISVNPPGSGNVRPLGRGTHQVAHGTELTLRPVPNAGWKFDHWEINGETVREESTRIKVTGNYEVVAHFTKAEEELTLPEVGSQPQPTSKVIEPRKCPIEPTSLPYRGNYAEMKATEDLLQLLPGKASLHQTEGILILGGGRGEPQPWSRLGVKLTEEHVKTKAGTFTVEKGKEYGVIYFCCKTGNVIVTGTSPTGTRAALMWLLNHPYEIEGKLLIVVEWVDANHNLGVQNSEVASVYEVP